MKSPALSFVIRLSLFVLFTVSKSYAQTNGTWINATSNSTWGLGTNWSGGSVANGIGATADFTTLDIAAARTVSLGANFMVGALVFGDATTPSNNWAVANGTGGPWALTLATTTGVPGINIVNQTTTISAVLAGSQGLAKSGTGALVLTGANTITGGITVGAGTLSFNNGSLGSNVVDFTANATLGWNGTNTQDVSANIKIEDGVTAILATGANNVTFATALQAGTGAITKTGAGTLTLTAANTFTGLTKINGGRIALSGGNDRLAANGSIALGQGAASGILQLGDASTTTNQTTSSLTIVGTGSTNAVVGGNAGISTLTINNSTAVAYAGLIGGSGSNENNLALTKSGTGTLTLSNAGNTFAGDVLISGGTLAITKSTALGATPKTITISGTVAAPSLKLDGTANDLALPAGLTLITSNDNTTVPAILNSAGNNAVAGNLSLTTGGFGTGNTRVKVTGGSLTLSGGVSPAASGLSLILDANANLTGTVSGTIADTGANTLAVTKAGAGTWLLSGANTYTGATAINGGTLQVNSIAANGTAQPLGAATSALSLGSGAVAGTLEYTGSADATLARGITSASAGGGIIKNSGGALLTLSGTQAKNGRPLTYTGGNIRITGRITGATAGDLNIDNANVTLTNNSNTFIGNTSVQNGSSLVVTNTAGSATGTGTVTVDATSRLAGTGLVNAGNNNSILVNGTVHVGDPSTSIVGDLDFLTSGTGSTVFGASSVLEIDIFSPSTADQLKVSGALEIISGATIRIGNPNHLGAWTEADVFKVLDWTSLTPNSSNFAIDASAFDLPSGYEIDAVALFSSGTLRLASLTPEPGRPLLLLLGANLLAMRRRRS